MCLLSSSNELLLRIVSDEDSADEDSAMKSRDGIGLAKRDAESRGLMAIRIVRILGGTGAISKRQKQLITAIPLVRLMTSHLESMGLSAGLNHGR